MEGAVTVEFTIVHSSLSLYAKIPTIYIEYMVNKILINIHLT